MARLSAYLAGYFWALSFFLATAACSRPCLAADDGPLAPAKRAQAEWRAALSSLRLHIVKKNDPNSRDVIEAGLQDIDVVAHEEWIWTDRGRFRRHNWSLYDGLVRTRSLQGGDGKVVFEAGYSEGPSEEAIPFRITLGHQVVRWTGELSGGVLAGLWWTYERQWFADLMAEGLIEYHSTELLDGVEMLKVAAPIRRPSAPTLFLDLILDPRHQYLPRSVSTREPPGSNSGASFTVDEFEEASPGWWFPKRVTMHTAFFTVPSEAVEIEMNPPLTPQLFQPPLPVGTSVTDLVHGTSYIVGGEAGKKVHKKLHDKHMAQRAESDKPTAGGVVVKISQEAQPSRTWLSAGRIGLFVIAIVVIAAAFVIRRRS